MIQSHSNVRYVISKILASFSYWFKSSPSLDQVLLLFGLWIPYSRSGAVLAPALPLSEVRFLYSSGNLSLGLPRSPSSLSSSVCSASKCKRKKIAINYNQVSRSFFPLMIFTSSDSKIIQESNLSPWKLTRVSDGKAWCQYVTPFRGWPYQNYVFPSQKTFICKTEMISNHAGCS